MDGVQVPQMPPGFVPPSNDIYENRALRDQLARLQFELDNVRARQ